MIRCSEIKILSKTLRKEMSEEAVFNNTAFKSSSGEYENALETFTGDKDNDSKGFQTGLLVHERETDDNHYQAIGGEREVGVYQSLVGRDETKAHPRMSSIKQSRKPTNTNKNCDSRIASNTSYSEANISEQSAINLVTVNRDISTEAGSFDSTVKSHKNATEIARNRGRSTPPNLPISDVTAQYEADHPYIETSTYEQVKKKTPNVAVPNASANYENVDGLECKKREVKCGHGCPGNRLMFSMVTALLVFTVATSLLVILLLLGVMGPQCLCNNQQIVKGSTHLLKRQCSDRTQALWQFLWWVLGSRNEFLFVFYWYSCIILTLFPLFFLGGGAFDARANFK